MSVGLARRVPGSVVFPLAFPKKCLFLMGAPSSYRSNNQPSCSHLASFTSAGQLDELLVSGETD